MKPICVMHVGPFKTSTTTLQQFLYKDKYVKKGMKEDNYYVPGINRNKLNHNRLVHCTRFESSRCPNENMRKSYLEDWDSQVNYAKDAGYNLIISSEELSRPDLNMTVFTSALLPQYKIHIVLYYRRFYDWLHSWYNQVTKNHDKNLTYVEWLDEDMLERDLDLYAVEVYKRYMKVPGVFNISVVNMHEDPENFNTYVRFACDHMDNAPHLCELAKSTPIRHSNPSVGLDWRLFRKRLPLHYSIELKDSDGRWEAIEAKFYRMENFPQKCLSEEWQSKLLQISEEAEKFLTPRQWYVSDEGLENLRSDFKEKINSKFCSMDIDQILLSSDWQDFLTDLEEDNEPEEGR